MSWGMKVESFACDCLSPQHTLRFIMDKEDGMMWAEVYLNKHTIWRRLWLGFKYIIGRDQNSGTWNDWIIDPQDYDRLVNFFQEARRLHIEKDTADYLKYKKEHPDESV